MFDLAERIIKAECVGHGIPVRLVRSKSRIRGVPAVRKIIVRRLRLETDLSWAAIGFLLHRNPATFRGGERPVPSLHKADSLTNISYLP
jgi:chromosomal replication initiation ATPase DnaA